MSLFPIFTGSGYRPASYIFNGTDEILTRTLSTSGAATTIATISMWLKTSAGTGLTFFETRVDANNRSQMVGGTDESLQLNATTSGSLIYSELSAASQIIITNTWHHYVAQYDSTQGTADDRIRLYVDGTLKADSPTQPTASLAHRFFENGRSAYIGALPTSFRAQRLAFIDVLEGVSQDPTAFAFDNGGTWTRKLYAGSYGTYGFKLDGTNLFADVSGNGQNFTGTNMDATNLDTADLPPYTN